MINSAILLLYQCIIIFYNATMKQSTYKTILAQHGDLEVIEKLAPFVTEARKQRIDSVISGRLSQLQLAIECPSDINNALAAVRSAEAMGVANVHIIQPEGDAISARKVTQGAFYWVNLHYHDCLANFLTHLKTQDIALAGGTVTATQPLSAVPVDKPLCLIIGNEARGLSDEAVAACTIEYTIPMVGMSESMNLSVSAAISMYDTSQRKRALLGCNSDLNATEQNHLRACYYLNSANPRMYPHLFNNS